MGEVLKVMGAVLIGIVCICLMPFVLVFVGMMFRFLMSLDVTWLIVAVLAAIVGYLIWG